MMVAAVCSAGPDTLGSRADFTSLAGGGAGLSMAIGTLVRAGDVAARAGRRWMRSSWPTWSSIGCSSIFALGVAY
jgi:hypothetical protein